MHERLLNDCAAMTAKALIDVIGHNFREEEMHDLFVEFYTACKAGIEAYCIQQRRMEQRMRPTDN